MYLIPTVVFLVSAYQQNASLYVTPYQLLILTIFAVCFSWLGNVASLKSIEMAPNPGYSLVISKSYVVMTTIVSIFLFGSEISWQSALAIVAIIIGMATLSVGKSTNQHVNPAWLPLAFLAFVCWGLISLTSKYLFTIGVGIIPLLVYTSGIVTIIIIGEIWKKKLLVKPTIEQMGLMVVMGISAAGFDYFMQTAIKSAPNVGFVNAINAGSIAIVTLCAAIFFKDELTVKKLGGVLIATAGLIALVI